MCTVFGTAAPQLSRAARIILVGAPGVGKGTQAGRLRKRFPQISSIGSGDLLRENVRSRTPLGMMAEAAVQAGRLVPDPLMVRLILGELKTRGWVANLSQPLYLSSAGAATAMSDSGSGSDLEVDDFVAELPAPAVPAQASEDPSASFILDGFPRTVSQAMQLDEQIPMNLVLEIVTPTSIILERISSRLVHAPSGRVYNTTFNPPRVAGRDDVTGEPLTRRADDDLDTWRCRLKKFDETSRPLLEHYRRKNLVLTVKGNSSDEITPALFREIERKFAS